MSHALPTAAALAGFRDELLARGFTTEHTHEIILAVSVPEVQATGGLVVTEAPTNGEPS